MQPGQAPSVAIDERQPPLARATGLPTRRDFRRNATSTKRTVVSFFGSPIADEGMAGEQDHDRIDVDVLQAGREQQRQVDARAAIGTRMSLGVRSRWLCSE